MFKKIFSYLQEHPYNTAIGTILGVVGIILGIMTWLFPQSQNIYIPTISETTKEEIKILHGSVFDLVNKISSLQTTLSKQEIIKENLGLTVTEKGYIIDITEENEDPFVANKRYLSVDFSNTTTIKYSILSSFDKPPIVTCVFSEDWYKTLSTADLSKEVEFTGVISGGSGKTLFYGSPIIINNCKIIK